MFPLLFASRGLGLAAIGLIKGVYPLLWGAGQLLTGHLSDIIGRKPLIVSGMLVQAAAFPAALALPSRPLAGRSPCSPGCWRRDGSPETAAARSYAMPAGYAIPGVLPTYMSDRPPALIGYGLLAAIAMMVAIPYWHCCADVSVTLYGEEDGRCR